MEPQVYNWTCSVCSLTWVINALGDTDFNREDAANLLGVPECVNHTYGLMSTTCMTNAFAAFGYDTHAHYATFDEAYAICRITTGTINPQGMYHFMGIRGVRNGNIWVANSAPGYCGVWDELDRASFNALGPVELVALSK